METFATVLVEVEGIMNRRPLTYVSSDSRDPDVLTPADFLYPGVSMHTSVNVLPPVPPGGGDALQYSWKNARKLVDAFWERWTKEYMVMLQARSKWQRTSPNLYTGQIVILVDELQSRDQWKFGVVEAVKGDGNHIRMVTVRMANGKRLERHSNRLVGLEIDP